MTVGIAAICKGDNPHAIVASDRMVTVGSGGAIEYEDTESKLEEVANNQDVAAAAVGAGISTFIDQIFERFFTLTENRTLSDMQDVLEELQNAYQEEVRATIEAQALQPYGYTLQELKDNEVNVPAHIQEQVRQDVNEILNQVEKQVRLIVTGVDNNGAKVHDIVRMDSNNYSQIGYTAVGTESAQLAFIRRDYDRFCSCNEALFTTLEAKKQAEERQGVGNGTDLILINSSGTTIFDEEKVSELEKELEKIRDAEREARENIINGWEI